ncbi:phosphotransferase [Williamsia sterculiae]|nr:phosphotransferase [Williamsia sterculiae]
MCRRTHDLDVDTVRRVIGDQIPWLAEEDVQPVDAPGTQSHLFRIGARCATKFPVADPDGPPAIPTRSTIAAEHAAMREFCSTTSVPSPTPLHLGRPTALYPRWWSVQTWVDGVTATPTSVASSDAFAADVASLIHEVRAADIYNRSFTGSGRGGTLTAHDAWVDECLRRSDHILPVDELRRAWTRSRLLPREDADVMAHTDLIPANLLATDSRLVGVLDTGGFSPADPALDLVAAWHLFDADRRALLRESLDVDELQWRRGAAWAFEQAIGLVWYYTDINPAMSELGRTTLGRLLDDPAFAV